jgi:Asp-tRNA(Asn)/Glu-tRNA(Gln) amidotransferase A subunit family amidase
MKTGSRAADCLRLIAERDPEIQAWVEVVGDPKPPLPGPLQGVPFGAKDIFETRGLATEYGSPLYAGCKGERDAHLVTVLREAGAVLLGKTHTTAFASFDPAPTRNPRLPGHTPGGSSSGSAAAVAAGMVPFAIGTQTLGSVLRPASYCGICGFKPSFGLIPYDGALPFAPSLDTVGFFTRTAAGMKHLWTAAFNGRFSAALERIVRLRVPAEVPMQRAIDDAVSRLRAAGVDVDELDPPAAWPDLLNAALVINRYEGARTHASRYRQFGDRLGTRLAALIREGLAVSEAEYESARGAVERARTDITALFWEYPAILTPSAAGPPPQGLESTGDPSHNAPWTALGVPAITIPMPGPLPLGLQLTAAWGRDDALISVAAQAEVFVG